MNTRKRAYAALCRPSTLCLASLLLSQTHDGPGRGYPWNRLVTVYSSRVSSELVSLTPWYLNDCEVHSRRQGTRSPMSTLTPAMVEMTRPLQSMNLYLGQTRDRALLLIARLTCSSSGNDIQGSATLALCPVSRDSTLYLCSRPLFRQSVR